MRKKDIAGYYGSNGQINAYIVMPGMEIPYMNADGDAADLQTKLTAAQNELKRLQSALATSQARYTDADSVCQTQDCTMEAKNIVVTEFTNIRDYTAQVKVQQDLVKSLTDSLNAANKALTDPVLVKIAADKAKSAEAAQLKKTLTMWIGGTVIILGSLYLLKKIKRA